MSGSIVCLGEVLLRFSAPGHERLLQTPSFNVHVGGAEANVAAALAQFGHRTRIASVVPTGPLGDAALGELARVGVDTTSVTRKPGRLGTYYFEQGAIRRASEVIYDRAGSAFAMASAADFDWDALFDGATHLHVSGVTPALGAVSSDLALVSVRAARARGLRVSVDGNFRGKLWQLWQGDAPSILRALFAEADLLLVNHRDVELVLGTRFDENADRAFQQSAVAAFDAFPNLNWMAGTQRVSEGVMQQHLGARLSDRSEGHFVAPPCVLDGIVDRIGAGDAFAAGIVHGLQGSWPRAETLAFALACAGLKHTIPGDFLRASEADVRAWMDTLGTDVRR